MERSRDGHSRPGEDAASDAVFFKALGDPTRLTVLRVLLRSRKRLNVSELAAQSGKKMSTVSEALKELKLATIVDCVRAGRQRLYAVDVPAVRERLGRLLSNLPRPLTGSG